MRSDRLTADEILLAARALETVEAIIQLHQPRPSIMPWPICTECRHPWPCNTVNLAVAVTDESK